MNPRPSRRAFLTTAAAALAAPAVPALAQQQKPAQQDAVQLPPLHNVPTEGPEKSPTPSEPPAQRTGYAIVGLGDLALKQILPAFGSCKYSKPVALVSGDPEKADRIAAQYGIRDSAIYNYKTYDNLAQDPSVQAIYIVLPIPCTASSPSAAQRPASTSSAKNPWPPAPATASA